MKTSTRWEEGRENEREGEGRGEKSGNQMWHEGGHFWPAMTFDHSAHDQGKKTTETLFMAARDRTGARSGPHGNIYTCLHRITHLLFCLAFFASLVMSFSHLYFTELETGGMKVRDFHWVISPQVSCNASQAALHIPVKRTRIHTASKSFMKVILDEIMQSLWRWCYGF